MSLSNLFLPRASTHAVYRYRNVYFHKRKGFLSRAEAVALTVRVETKNTWARDDPAILILIAACLTGMYQAFKPLLYVLIWQVSVRGCLVSRIFVWPTTGHTTSPPDDLPRLSIGWYSCSDYSVVCLYLNQMHPVSHFLLGSFQTAYLYPLHHMRHLQIRRWSGLTPLMFTPMPSFLFT